MKCADFQKYLIPYAEGTLPERLHRPVEEHLAACASCSRELSDLSEMVDLLRHTEYPAMEPAADLCSRVMARIADKPARRPWWVSGLPAFSAAAAGLILFGVLAATRGPSLFHERGIYRDIPRIESPASPMLQKAPSAGTKSVTSTPGIRPGGPHDFADGHAERSSVGGKPHRALQAGPKKHTAGGTESPNRVSGSGSAFSTYSKNAPAPSTGDRLKDMDRDAGGVKEAGEPGSPKLSGAPVEEAAPAAGAEDAATDSRPTTQAILGGGKPLTTDAPQAGPPAGWDDKFSGRGNARSACGNTIAPEEPDRKMTEADILELERKLNEFPTSRAVLTDLLKAYRETGRAKDEYAIAKRLTKLDPKNAEYWFAQGQAAERAKMPGTAAASYRRAIALKLTGPDLDLARSRLKTLGAGKDR